VFAKIIFQGEDIPLYNVKIAALWGAIFRVDSENVFQKKHPNAKIPTG